MARKQNYSYLKFQRDSNKAAKREAARAAEERAVGLQARTWRDDRGSAWCVFHDRAVPAIVAPYGSNYHIVQSKDWIVITYEWNTERRVIPLDGRKHLPKGTQKWNGDSIGRWEGDTLVIDTVGYNDVTPGFGIHLEKLHTIERIRRTDMTHLEIAITAEDPEAYTRPWTTTISAQLAADHELLEFVCPENNKDMQNFGGLGWKGRP